MERGPKKTVGLLLPMKISEPLKQLAEEDGRPLSVYLRQVLRRYIQYMEEHGEPPWEWWSPPK